MIDHPTMIDQRQRAAIVLISFIYFLGWLVGRAGGRADGSEEMLKAHAAGTRRT